MATKRKINLNWPLEYLENLDISSENSGGDGDGEDFISKGKLVIVQPTIVRDKDTDEDSEAEN